MARTRRRIPSLRLDNYRSINAVSESFFATYKKELIHTRPWNNAAEFRQHTFLWIEGYYNRRRRHSTLDYLTPLEYELGFRKLTELASLNR